MMAIMGEIETVKHFILECPLYEGKGQQMGQQMKNLFSQLVINYLDMDAMFFV